VAVASSLAASRFHTLVRHGDATPAALTGGFHVALLVCGLSALLAVPAAALLIRRTGRPRRVSIEQERQAAMTASRE
jgi:hypothetical protein